MLQVDRGQRVQKPSFVVTLTSGFFIYRKYFPSFSSVKDILSASQ